MEMNIRDSWDRLSPGTQQWLVDNPGCVILPRTMTATIAHETGLSAACDQHGETTLSREDIEFIRAQANRAPLREPEPDYRFFDANQP